MLKRARISCLVSLIVATLGFNGVIDSSIAQTLFYLLLAFAFLSFLFGMFEADSTTRRPIDPSSGQPRTFRTSRVPHVET